MTKMSSAFRTSGNLKRGVKESIHAVVFFSAEYATRAGQISIIKIYVIKETI